MTDHTPFKLAGVPSPADERDYPVSRLAPLRDVIPASFRLPFRGAIRKQGDIGACVGMSLAYTREIKESEQHNRVMRFSPGFIYGLRMPGQRIQDGMICREALKNLKDYGAVLEEDFPHLDEMPTIKFEVDNALPGLFAKAKPYRISAYAQVSSVDQIKTALLDKDLGPVTILVPIYQSFFNVTPQRAVVPEPTGGFRDYHQMTITGWRDDETWIVLNSWGAEWGDQGYCYYPMDFDITEAWTITDNILPHPEADPELHQYWRVQIGAYSVKTNAENMKAELKSKGFDAYLVKPDDLYRVQTGAFSVQDNALRLKERLTAIGYKPILKHY